MCRKCEKCQYMQITECAKFENAAESSSSDQSLRAHICTDCHSPLPLVFLSERFAYSIHLSSLERLFSASRVKNMNVAFAAIIE